MYWANFENILQLRYKIRARFVSLIFPLQKFHLPFLHLERAHEYWGNLGGYTKKNHMNINFSKLVWISYLSYFYFCHSLSITVTWIRRSCQICISHVLCGILSAILVLFYLCISNCDDMLIHTTITVHISPFTNTDIIFCLSILMEL